MPLSPQFEGRFGRMFRRLPPAPPLGDSALLQLAASMVEPSEVAGWSGQVTDRDNEDIPAGYTYFGQFLDHDVTFDPTSSLDRSNDPDALVDFRTPRYDLDSVYGSGPADEPFQYKRHQPGRMLVGTTPSGEADLPRNHEGIALIGDPRNDENLIVSQLHLVFLGLHNKFADQVAAESPSLPPAAQFAEAQRRTRWHYQWVIVHDYLPRIVGKDTVGKILVTGPDGPDIRLRHYRVRTRPYMPVEFSAAAFRFGHSMIRGVYDLNAAVTAAPIFIQGEPVGDFDDLRGRRSLPPRGSIEWSRFFQIGPSVPQPSRKIDSLLAPALATLPGGGEPLAVRNLRRGEALCLPSGQDVARHLKEEPLTSAELGAPEPTPLWFYILKEAELHPSSLGLRLGPVGGRIVAEVILGLLNGDRQSYFSQDPTWRPTVPAADGATVTLGDLIMFATGP